MRKKRLLIASLGALILLGASYFAYTRWTAEQGRSRESLLEQLPATASSVIYVDLAELRQGDLLKSLAKWTAGSVEEPEYQAFVKETGFDYERDLNQLGIAFRARNSKNSYFAIADGHFDRKKISDYLHKNASSEQKSGREIFHVTSSMPGRNVALAFLSDDRIALTDGDDLSADLESANREVGHQEWSERFERLSGVPAFVLIRQEAAIGKVLSERAPGGIASPQLAQLLNRLTWVSIAGKPEGTSFRVVIDGECPNEMVMRQLTEFFTGITLLAQAGLNDPKLREKMDATEREAYLQLLNSIEVTKLNRGDSQSVRVSLVVLPDTWSKLSALSNRASQDSDPSPGGTTSKTQSKNKKAGAKAPASHH